MNSLVRRQEVIDVDDFTSRMPGVSSVCRRRFYLSHAWCVKRFFYVPRVFRKSPLEIFARACGARGEIIVEFVVG